MQKALDKFASNGVSIMTSKGKKITSEHVVGGNREVTLDLLWNISSHHEILSKIQPEQLQEEIDFLKKNLKIKKEIEKVQNKKEFKVQIFFCFNTKVRNLSLFLVRVIYFNFFRA